MSLTLLTGCVVGPDYEAPAIPETDPWTDPTLITTEPPSAWWSQFDDPTLVRLVDQALADNLDLAMAEERIVQARAARVAAGASDEPVVDAVGGAVRQRQSETGPLPVGRIPGLPVYQTVYEAGFDAAWEFDLFGRTRRAVEAADAQLGAAVANRDAARVSIAAEVARSYYELRGAQAELASAAAAVAAASQTAALVGRRVAVGAAPRDALRRAEADAALERTRLAPLRARRDAAVLSLGILTGTPPETHLALTDAASSLPTLDPVPVGTRGDLLRRRPDVRATERALAAATASIGIAEGALYPRVGLSASGGFTSLESGQLLDSSSRRWNLGPLLSWNVLDSGRIDAEITAAESRQREAALAYERAVLRALTEAERAIRSYGHALDGLSIQSEAVAAVAASDAAIERRFDAGATSLLDRLDSQRRLQEARVALARTHGEATLALVAVYKALGGGWDVAAGR